MKTVNVVASQLQNLTVNSCFEELLITAPNLVSLLFEHGAPSLRNLQFSTDLPLLEKVVLEVICASKWSGSRIVALFQQLNNVEFLTLSLEFVKPLISYMKGISLQPSPFHNLKSLKIYPLYIPSDDLAHLKVNMTPEVRNYFLDGSPSANFTLISYELELENREKASGGDWSE